MNDYKRQYRELDQETKQKISDSSRNKPKSEEQKKRISQGMLKYWEGIVRFVILQIAMFFSRDTSPNWWKFCWNNLD